MTNPNAASRQSRLNRLKAIWRVFRERVQIVMPLRLILLIAGIASIVYGQYLMEQRLSQSGPSFDAELWNITYRLDIPN